MCQCAKRGVQRVQRVPGPGGPRDAWLERGRSGELQFTGLVTNVSGARLQQVVRASTDSEPGYL
jgi:hypothetical protein